MDGRRRREFLESLSDFAPYETFYEAGAMLGGRWSRWRTGRRRGTIPRDSANGGQRISGFSGTGAKSVADDFVLACR